MVPRAVTVRGFVVAILAIVACATPSPDPSDPGATDRTPGPTKDGGAASVDGDSEVDREGPSREGGAKRPPPAFVSGALTCKLVNEAGNDDPTPNQTHFTANLRATDLGIPLDHEGTLYFFFGDTVGYKAIWNFGESQPDAVGYATVSAAQASAQPSTLCTALRFVNLPKADSLGPAQDARIAADWAGVFMRPPPGQAIGDYVHNPAGHGAFPNLPGDFEVPSGAFSHAGAIWVFYTTVVGPANVTMKGSYLAKWATPSTAGVPVYDILYPVDERFDANGPLRGDFINVAALVRGEHVYLYGTGDYRRSPVHLARKALAKLAEPGGFERWDPDTRAWKDGRASTKPVVAESGNGELSVRYFAAVDRFMMLNQQELNGMNRVVARFAEAPEGPWSDAVVVADMADPAFRAKHCCSSGSSCGKDQLFHCDRAGFYGTYLLPEARTKPDGSFVAAYVMSTWDPYNVVLMEATFE